MSFTSLIALITFPGVIMHEMSHKFFCDWAGVKVLKVCYFRFGNPAGYVIHESAKKFSQSFLISVGPMIIGTIVSVLFFLLFMQHPKELSGFIFVWLGLVIASASFPSTGDAAVLWVETVRHIWRNPLAVVGFPIALIIWVVNKLDIFHLNYIFAFGLFWLVVVYLG